jgi:hypothetical protein
MMNGLTLRAAAWLAAASLAALAACGGDSTGPRIATVSVTAPSTQVQAGQTLQLTATVRDQNGAVMSGQAVTWSSSEQAVATVSGTGLVAAVAAGSARVTAASGGVSGFLDITVTPAPPAATTIDVTAAATEVLVGGTVQVTAQVRDQYGDPMPAAPVAWSTSNDLLATVSATGLVTTGGVGTVRITATSGTLSAFADINVNGTSCTGAHVGTIAPGQTVNGALALTDCVLADGTFADAWLLTLDDPAIVEIEMGSADFDAYLILSATDVDYIAEDDDSGPGTDALIWKPLPAGTYLVWANSWEPGEKGAYEISVRVAQPCAALTGTLDVGDTVAGTLETGGCTAGPDRHADWWELRQTDKQTVAIDLISTSFDAYMYLLDENFAYLAEDDDGGDGLGAGTYYVLVTSYDTRESGDYTLSAQPAAAAGIAPDASPVERTVTVPAAKTPRDGGGRTGARVKLPMH